MLQQLKSLTRDSAIYGVGHIVSRLVTFLLLPYYSFQMTPAEYGEITLYFLFIATTQTFYSYGLDFAYLRYFTLTKEEEGRRVVNGTTLITTLASSVVLTLLIVAAAPALGRLVVYEPTHPALVAPMIRLCALILLLDTLSMYPYMFLRGIRQPYRFTTIKLVNVAVNIGLNIWFVGYLDLAIAGVIWANVISSAVALVLLAPSFLKGVNWKFDRVLIREMIRFGIPNVPTYLFVMVIELADRKILELYRGLTEAGLYSAGYKLGMFMAVVTGAFRFAWQPFFLSHADRPDAPRLFARVLTYYLLVTVGLFLFLTFFVDYVIKTRWPGVGYIIHPQYWPGLAVFPLILLAHIFDGVYANLMVGVYLKKLTARLPLVTGVGAVFTIAACLALVPAYGMMAAAWVTVVAFVLEAVMLWLIVRRAYPVPYEWGRIVKLSLACAVVIGLFYFPGFQALWQRVLLILVFPALLYGLGFLDDREKFHLRRLLLRS